MKTLHSPLVCTLAISRCLCILAVGIKVSIFRMAWQNRNGSFGKTYSCVLDLIQIIRCERCYFFPFAFSSMIRCSVDGIYHKNVYLCDAQSESECVVLLAGMYLVHSIIICCQSLSPIIAICTVNIFATSPLTSNHCICMKKQMQNSKPVCQKHVTVAW